MSVSRQDRWISGAVDVPSTARRSRLVVNADDFGYSDGVSRGILDAHDNGPVTATGVLANSRCFDDVVDMLCGRERLCPGVHLTLTSGEPLSDDMRRALDANGWSVFPSDKFAVISAILRRRLPLASIEREWEKQIERMIECGIGPVFLNSHEHVHMLRPLHRIAVGLARRHRIHHLRRASPEWPVGVRPSAVVRMLMLATASASVPVTSLDTMHGMFGASVSGRLNERFLHGMLRRMRPGRTYELMCHPGHRPQDDGLDERLVKFHRWDEERAALQSVLREDVVERYGVELIGYAELESDRA